MVKVICLIYVEQRLPPQEDNPEQQEDNPIQQENDPIQQENDPMQQDSPPKQENDEKDNHEEMLNDEKNHFQGSPIENAQSPIVSGEYDKSIEF